MTRRLATLAVLAALAAAGCHKKPVTKAAAPAPEAAPVAAVQNPADALNGEEARRGLPDLKRETLSTVYFEFDSSTLADAAKETLKKDFSTLQENATVAVRLEGHSDERGGTQYNVALGERRARAVKAFLTTLGLPTARLETVSYGEEKPADLGHDDAAWSKNRRVELTVVGGNDKVSSSR